MNARIRQPLLLPRIVAISGMTQCVSQTPKPEASQPGYLLSTTILAVGEAPVLDAHLYVCGKATARPPGRRRPP
jgi:hypothetical protein